VDLDRIGSDQVQIRVHRFDDIADPLSGLIRIHDPPMIVALSVDEREEVVVEREEDPVVLDGKRQLLLVGCAE
jgi:hypothetical protein